MTCSWWKR